MSGNNKFLNFISESKDPWIFYLMLYKADYTATTTTCFIHFFQLTLEL